MKAVALWFLWGVSALFADFESHLKGTPGKEQMVSIPGIDFIYMINLDQRPEKWERSLGQLLPFGILPYRFSAVNGWELSLADLQEVGVVYSPEMARGLMGTRYDEAGGFEPSHGVLQEFGKTYFCHCMARGAIGIALSHISVLRDAWESGYELIWVMEDDIQVIRDPRLMSGLVGRLDGAVGREGWDVLFTDRDIRDANGHYYVTYWAGRRPDYESDNPYTLKESVAGEFIRVGARSGAHSMILNRAGIGKLLRYFLAHQIFLPYDMEYILPRGIKLFTVVEDVVSNQPRAPSDNGAPNYLGGSGC